MPTISVIVPVYKVEAYLQRCIDSILGQTYSDFELILVNDGSPDRCGVICDEYVAKDSRIRVIHKENGGLSDARNAGFAISQGEWITFVDSDDYLHPKMLEALYSAVMQHSVLVSVCAYAQTHGEPPVEIHDTIAMLWTAEDFYLFRNVNATVAWGKLYHRSVVLPYPRGKIHEDEFITYRILFECGQVAVIDTPLYCYFQNPAGITKGKNFSAERYIHKLEALQERFFYFRDTHKADPAKAATAYWIQACWALNAIGEQGKPEYMQAKKSISAMYSQIRPWLNKYEKIYAYLVRFRWPQKWLIRNDFEPIQNAVRRWQCRK